MRLCIVVTLFILTMVMTLISAAKAAECGNFAYNIVRSMECEAYTTDWAVHKDLRDKRLGVIDEWLRAHPDQPAALEFLTKEGMLRRSHALTRDLAISPDNEMWKSRNCQQLPLCIVPSMPSKQPRDLENPPPKAQPRNRRTGGTYCGPRDRSRGYCR